MAENQNEQEPEWVPAFKLSAQQIAHDEPHLPEWFVEGHPGETIQGSYKVCLRREGSVSAATVVNGIGGVDEFIIGHIKSRWLYRPQPVPVCTVSVIIFKVR